jgi:hypothetical protein
MRAKNSADGSTRTVLRSVLALTAALLIGLGWVSTAAAVPSQIDPHQASTWYGDIEPMVVASRTDLESAWAVIYATLRDSAALTDKDRFEVLGYLDAVAATIADILDPGEWPALDLSAVDPAPLAADPATLQDYADATRDLADETVDELARGASASPEYVVARLKTIEHLIVRESPHNFRDLVNDG